MAFLIHRSFCLSVIFPLRVPLTRPRDSCGAETARQRRHDITCSSVHSVTRLAASNSTTSLWIKDLLAQQPPAHAPERVEAAFERCGAWASVLPEPWRGAWSASFGRHRACHYACREGMGRHRCTETSTLEI